jgi:hypothetical protein
VLDGGADLGDGRNLIVEPSESPSLSIASRSEAALSHVDVAAGA